MDDLLHLCTKLFALRRKEIETLVRRLKEGTLEQRVPALPLGSALDLLASWGREYG
jgi:hypothetical protein